MAAFIPYSTALPSGPYNLEDLVFASVAGGMPKPDLVQATNGILTFGYIRDPAPSTVVLSAWSVTVLSNPTPQTPSRVRGTLEGKVVSALASNDTFLAMVSPTAAQVATQVKALTRQVNTLGRILLGQLDTTAGT